MKNLMTRVEAASYLGCSEQTITNWVANGLLGGYNDTTSRRFYVNADDVKKYSERYKMIAISESKIQAKEVELRRKEDDVDEQLKKVISENASLASFSCSEVRDAIFMIYASTNPATTKIARVFKEALNGKNIKDIAEEMDFTRERIRQLILIAVRKLQESIQKILDANKNNESLRCKVEDMKTKLFTLLGNQCNLQESEPIPMVLNQYCHDFGLSVRTSNCLYRMDIETIGQLVTHKREDLMKCRNFGRKCIDELDALISKLGLSWDMEMEKSYVIGSILNDESGFLNNLFDKSINDVIDKVAEKYDLQKEDATKIVTKSLRDYLAIPE